MDTITPSPAYAEAFAEALLAQHMRGQRPSGGIIAQGSFQSIKCRFGQTTLQHIARWLVPLQPMEVSTS